MFLESEFFRKPFPRAFVNVLIMVIVFSGCRRNSNVPNSESAKKQTHQSVRSQVTDTHRNAGLKIEKAAFVFPPADDGFSEAFQAY